MGSRNKATRETFTPRPSHRRARLIMEPALCCSYCKSGPKLRVWKIGAKVAARLICPVCHRLYSFLGRAVRRI